MLGVLNATLERLHSILSLLNCLEDLGVELLLFFAELLAYLGHQLLERLKARLIPHHGP